MAPPWRFTVPRTGKQRQAASVIVSPSSRTTARAKHFLPVLRISATSRRPRIGGACGRLLQNSASESRQPTADNPDKNSTTARLNASGRSSNLLRTRDLAGHVIGRAKEVMVVTADQYEGRHCDVGQRVDQPS